MDFHYRVCPTLFLGSYFVGNKVLLVTGRGGEGREGQGTRLLFPANLLAELLSEQH